MHGLESFLRGLDWMVPLRLLISVIPALLCITLHELAHGFVASMLGDDTARRAGRLTLNPIKHIDVLGLLMLVVFKFGWAKPVPVDMRNFKNPRRDMALCAAAGPLANLLISVVTLFLYGLLLIPLSRAGEVGELAAQLFVTTAYMSLTLAIFNIIPIPPLDGSKVLYSFLPERSYRKLLRYERYGMIALMALIVITNRMPVDPLSYAAGRVYELLLNVAQLGLDIAGALL